MDSDEDTHYCLKCHTTIEGLENYINHRKKECPALQSVQRKSKDGIQAKNCTASSSQSTVSENTLISVSSPPTSPSKSIYSSFTSPARKVIPVSIAVSSPSHDTIAVSDSVTPFMRDSFIGLNLYNCEKKEEHKEGSASDEQPSLNLNIDSLLSNKENHGAKEKKQNISVEVTEAMTFVNAAFSPTTSRIVDPNEVLTDKHVSDFFASLELQSKVPPDSSENLDKSVPSPQKALPISSILDDLGFSSDSDFIPSDEELLSYEDEHPPRNHTGGKWKPGQRPYSYRGKYMNPGKQVKTTPKLRLQSPHKGGKTGKESTTVNCNDLVSSEQDNSLTEKDCDRIEKKVSDAHEVLDIHTYAAQNKSDTDSQTNNIDNYSEPSEPDETYQTFGEEEDISLLAAEGTAESLNCDVVQETQIGLDNTQVVSEVTISTDGDQYTCTTCDKTIVGKFGYQRHLESSYHKKMLSKINDGSKASEVEEQMFCEPCGKKLFSKYSYVRHLLTGLHQRKAKETSPIELDATYQYLLLRQLPFQCLLCRYFCGKQEDLITHTQTDNHKEKTETLTGPIMCVRCKFKTSSNEELVDHLPSSEHKNVIKKSNRPVVIREMRSGVPCKLCSVVMHSATQLARHMRAQHKQNRSKQISKNKSKNALCEHCNYSTVSWSKLLLHMRKTHKNIKNFHCKPCRKSFTDKERLHTHKRSKKHKRLLSENEPTPPEKTDASPKAVENNLDEVLKQGTVYKCNYCDFLTDIYGGLRPHYIKEHASKVYTCEPCDKVLVSRNTWFRHLQTPNHKYKSSEHDKDKVKLMKCSNCSRKFLDKNRMDYHQAIAHSSDLLDTVDPDKVKGLNQKHTEFLRALFKNKNYIKNKNYRIKCPECGKSISHRGLVAHLCMHEGVKPYQCNYCSKKFHGPCFLKRHLKTHFGLCEFVCDICNKVFGKCENLRNHIKTKHRLSDEVYICSVCAKESYSIIQHRAHERTHTKPYKCTHQGCRRAYSHVSELNDHTRVHTQEKPYLCDQCGYAGKSTQQLNRHRRTHTGEKKFHCEYCEYRSGNSTNLRRHMRIHTGSKPYKCPYCKYSCNTFENLRKHILHSRKHQGRNVYPCKFCDFGTNACEEIRQHLIDQHKEQCDLPDMDAFTVSVFLGLYVKNEDPRDLPEGQMAIPAKERQKRSTQAKPAVNKPTKKEVNVNYQDGPAPNSWDVSCNSDPNGMPVIEVTPWINHTNEVYPQGLPALVKYDSRPTPAAQQYDSAVRQYETRPTHTVRQNEPQPAHSAGQYEATYRPNLMRPDYGARPTPRPIPSAVPHAHLSNIVPASLNSMAMTFSQQNNKYDSI